MWAFVPAPLVDAPQVVALGLLTSGRRVLVTRRPDPGPLHGMWQFPGGKVEFGEHPWDALCRELHEELSLRITRGTLFGIYSHVYDFEGREAHYILVAYHVRVARARVSQTDDRRWATLKDLRRLPILAGSKPIVTDLARRWPS